jgi:hypothetical protein
MLSAMGVKRDHGHRTHIPRRSYRPAVESFERRTLLAARPVRPVQGRPAFRHPFSVNPIADGVTEGAETLTATIVSSDSYDATGAAAGTTISEAAPPAAPANLTASKQSQRRVRLTWRDNATNESGFYVYSSRDGINWTRQATVPPRTGSGGTKPTPPAP